jgi:hypothetical protein
MHGGALGSGAPKGNKNALKHGLYTRAAKAQRRQLQALIQQSRGAHSRHQVIAAFASCLFEPIGPSAKTAAPSFVLT